MLLMSAGGAPGLSQGFVRVRMKGEDLAADGAQLVIGRTGTQGGTEYLRAYNEIGGAAVDGAEALQYRWGADEGRITPYAVAVEANELSFDLGRNVNAHLDQQTNYRLTLCLDGAPVPRECTLAWARVAPVRPGDLASFVARPQAAPPSPVAPAGPAAPTATEVVAPPPVVVPSTPPAPTTSSSSAVVIDTTASDRARSVWPIAAGAALLLILAVAGGAYWWFLGRDKTATTIAGASTPDPASPATSSGSAGASAGAGKGAGASAASIETREQRLARIVAQGADVALAAGRTAQAAKELDEAEFLYRNACDRGKVEACRLAGQLFDPVDLVPGRDTQRSPADARQAVSLYRKAFEAGSADAEKDLERLREAIEKAAQAGDSTARVLLDTWPKKP
ncbi:MAG: sel1 repeat family protein [Alphaproteobacteria bacterium]|nr:sel1 repeat family protein [Alphaproteobacteria bacterium]